QVIEIDVDIIAIGIASFIEEIEKIRNILEESDQHSLKNYINSRFLTIPASFLESVNVVAVRDFDRESPYIQWIKRLHALLKVMVIKTK
ncbi:hypothetical protein MXB_5237, partial [Myxobolus squamalis]